MRFVYAQQQMEIAGWLEPLPIFLPEIRVHGQETITRISKCECMYDAQLSSSLISGTLVLIRGTGQRYFTIKENICWRLCYFFFYTIWEWKMVQCLNVTKNLVLLLFLKNIGYFQLGPASVEAVKKGQIGLSYDVAFVLAEVNAGKPISWMMSISFDTLCLDCIITDIFS